MFMSVLCTIIISLLKELFQCSTKGLKYLIRVPAKYCSTGDRFNRAQELSGAVDNEILKCVISQNGMIDLVCLDITVQIRLQDRAFLFEFSKIY